MPEPDEPMPATELEPRRIFADRYELGLPIGRGGMGEVLRAWDTKLRRAVAIKMLKRQGGDGAARHTARLVREARAVAALSHPNVVAVFDVGDNEGAAFIVMELLEGGSLFERLRAGPVGRELALDWLVQVADALAAAHAAGLVHRDIKPANLLLDGSGRIKVADFGIVKEVTKTVTGDGPTASSVEPFLTVPGMLVGTPLYMAPEQLRAEEIDGRADQYAWGIVGYELLAGIHPYRVRAGVEFPDVAQGRFVPERLPPTTGLHPAIEAILFRALSADRSARAPTMNEVAAGLRSARQTSNRTHAVPARPMPAPVGALPSFPPAASSNPALLPATPSFPPRAEAGVTFPHRAEAQVPWQPRRSRMPLWAVLAGVASVLALVGAVGTVLARRWLAGGSALGGVVSLTDGTPAPTAKICVRDRTSCLDTSAGGRFDTSVRTGSTVVSVSGPGLRRRAFGVVLPSEGVSYPVDREEAAALRDQVLGITPAERDEGLLVVDARDAEGHPFTRASVQLVGVTAKKGPLAVGPDGSAKGRGESHVTVFAGIAAREFEIQVPTAGVTCAVDRLGWPGTSANRVKVALAAGYESYVRLRCQVTGEVAPAADAVGPAAQTQWIASFVRAFNAHDVRALGALYAPDAVFVELGSEGAATKKVADVIAGYRELFDTFSETRVAPARSFHMGDVAVLEFAQGGVMKSTGKRYGYVGATVLWFDEQGKVTRDETYYDALTVDVQLGLAKPPYSKMTVRPVRDVPPAGDTWEQHFATATSGTDDAKTMAVRDKLYAHALTPDSEKGLFDVLTENVVFAEYDDPTDAFGRPGVAAAFKDWHHTFSNMRMDATHTWLCGEYVLFEGTFSGKHTGPWGPLKGTGREFTSHFFDVTHVTAEKKVDRMWTYASSSEILGLRRQGK